MTLLHVPYIYGKPVIDKAFERFVEAKTGLFPNSHSYFWGGCQLGSAGGGTEALVCLKCREAEKRWFETNGLSTFDGLILS